MTGETKLMVENEEDIKIFSWTMKNRENLKVLQEADVLETKKGTVFIFFNDFSRITGIDVKQNKFSTRKIQTWGVDI